MIRVAMLSEYSGDEQSVDGGVQAVTKYLVEELARSRQLDVHVLSFKYGASRVDTWEADGFTRHIVPARRLGAFSAYKHDQREMDDYLHRLCPHIVHSQGAGHYGIVATRSRYPTIITIHGIMSEEAKHAASLRLRLRRRFISALSEKYCIKADKNTILISPYVAEYYGDRLSGQSFIIPNPVPPGFFDLARAEMPGRILFAGRLLPLKGLHDLLPAIALISKSQHIELILAGSIDNQRYVKRLQSQAEDLGIKDIIQFRGILGETQLLDEYAKASVLVLPSYQETAPMVIQEAMAAGLPVIASRVGGVPSQITEGETGMIFEPGDIQRLTECLTSLLGDDEMRRSFANAARSQARDLYRADRIAEKTIDVYRRVLSCSGG